MTIKYSPRLRDQDRQKQGSTSTSRHFCFCCALSIALVGMLAAFSAFYFKERVGSLITHLSTPTLGNQNIEVAVTNHTPAVDLCVYDFGCEDGDIVALTLNGRSVFNGELYATHQCIPGLNVQPGENFVVLTALNGTGGKGGCPNNINTGALIVAGTDQNNRQQYSWSQLEGESAIAKIVARPLK